eukprot:3872301-Rhodomonas_salina.1
MAWCSAGASLISSYGISSASAAFHNGRREIIGVPQEGGRTYQGDVPGGAWDPLQGSPGRSCTTTVSVVRGSLWTEGGK